RQRPESIWPVGIRVVPFTFVPVSARVPACQQSARRWVVRPVTGGCAAGRVDSLSSQSRSGWVWAADPRGLLIAGQRPEVRRRPKAKRDTPDLGGRRRAETRRLNGWKRRETGEFLTRHRMAGSGRAGAGPRA